MSKNGIGLLITEGSLQLKDNFDETKNAALQDGYNTGMPLYSKCLELNRIEDTEELGKKEWKILQKILGPKKYG